ncbi:MAG: hypothetical protein P1V18_00755 [Candidatus Gracilibacteria bacterium]|nr:hypothetical protein [Candidatus Gracilibacteria bacterium]
MKKIIVISGVLIIVFASFISYEYFQNNSLEPIEPEIAEEEYLVLGDEPPFRMKSLPEDQVEVTADQQSGKQVVEVKEEGYKLELDPELRVVTREVEKGRILIYKDDCRVVVNRKDDTEGMTIVEWEKIEKEYETESFGADLKKFQVEKINEFESFTAYTFQMETVQFGLEKSILFELNNYIYSISSAFKEGECIPLRTILEGVNPIQ